MGSRTSWIGLGRVFGQIHGCVGSSQIRGREGSGGVCSGCAWLGLGETDRARFGRVGSSRNGWDRIKSGLVGFGQVG